MFSDFECKACGNLKIDVMVGHPVGECHKCSGVEWRKIDYKTNLGKVHSERDIGAKEEREAILRMLRHEAQRQANMAKGAYDDLEKVICGVMETLLTRLATVIEGRK